MLMFEWQSQITKAWFDVAQTGARVMADSYLSASRETSRMFGGGYTPFPVGASAFPFSWMSAFAPQPSPAWPFPTAMWSMTPGFNLSAFNPMSAFNPWANSWVASGWAGNAWANNAWANNPWMNVPWTFVAPTPAQATASFFDVVTASYRTPGGHAATMILTPFQLAPGPAKRPWWEWPAPNGSFLLH